MTTFFSFISSGYGRVPLKNVTAYFGQHDLREKNSRGQKSRVVKIFFPRGRQRKRQNIIFYKCIC